MLHGSTYQKQGFVKFWYVQNVFDSNRMVLLAHCHLTNDATNPHNADGVIVPKMDPPGPTLCVEVLNSFLVINSLMPESISMVEDSPESHTTPALLQELATRTARLPWACPRPLGLVALVSSRILSLTQFTQEFYPEFAVGGHVPVLPAEVAPLLMCTLPTMD
jgi:hypothetical protein